MNPVQTTTPVAVDQWPPPRLLVEWSSPWEEFKTAIRPALSKSPKALAGEAPTRMFPYRGMLACWLAECLLLIVVIVLPEKIASLQPYTPPALPKWDVIYYWGDELPQTEDRGGAQTGKSGGAGGQQAHHRTQTIRVARGDRPSERVVDAPKLDLPHSDSSVANLLAFKPLPGPPPAEGMRSSLTVPALPSPGIVAPAPEVNSAASRNANALSANIVAPAPEVNSVASRNANALSASIVAPAPAVSHSNTRTAPALTAAVVAPAPDVAPDKMHAAGAMNQTVIAPPPRDEQRDLASSRAPVTPTADVVAPPVSAPARAALTSAKVSLPAPAVVAPPPSQVSRDLNSWGNSATGNIRTNPVPPAPGTAGGGTFTSRGGVAALAARVVPPPPAAAGGGAVSSRGSVGTLASQVVPPPPSAAAGGASLSRGGAGTLSAQVVPPPMSASDLGGRNGVRTGGSPLGSAAVVPPPPSLGGGRALSGNGRGNKGAGAGGPLDLGSAVAPPSSGRGSTAGSGVVVSAQPGTKIGVPNATGGGAIAMSPSGTAKTGLGGSGGGAGIGKGSGPGSGMQGAGPGAGREGSGRGSDPSARAGISPYPGQGGAGSGANGPPEVPGVSVQGGTTTITLPSFGGPGENTMPNGPGRSSTTGQKGSRVTVVATSRSGGVFARYGELKGDRVYSIYIETSLGTAVMQFADPASAAHPYTEDLVAPEPMRRDLPDGLRPTRVVFAAILDRFGLLKNLKVLEPGAAETTSKLLAALPNWKFRPAFHGEEPVEVTAILGFGVDTR